MPSDTETYLAKVKERDAAIVNAVTELMASSHNAEEHGRLLALLNAATAVGQADVEPLGEILECQRRIIDAKDKLLTAYRLGGRATPGNALDTIRDETEAMNRIARAAMETKGG
jgi:hypothetical protein